MTHIYFIVKHNEENILVDPTYLQFIFKEEDRRKFLYVLLAWFKSQDELADQIDKIPIENERKPSYYGFDSEKTRQLFKKDKGYKMISEERAIVTI